MKTSWHHFFRRIASVVFTAGATAWSSAQCYAQQLAFDSASDAVYADGWQGEVTNKLPTMGPGDNGGFGFTPWNFDNDIYQVPVIGIRSMDGPPTAADPMRTQSPFNQVGSAWRLGLNYNETGEESWKDVVHVGRGLASPLQEGQTISIVVDPPGENIFFDIESIRFNTGGANVCPGCEPVAQERFRLRMFNWTDWTVNGGRWRWTGAEDDVYTSLFLRDKGPGEHDEFPEGAAGTNQGLRIDFKLTDSETFDLTLTPLDDPAAAYTATGPLMNFGAGTIDWIEFEHYGRPTPAPDPNVLDTDFFIRSIEVTGTGTPVISADFDSDDDEDGADFMRWQRGAGTTVGGVRGTGDANNDGAVNGADLGVWKQQFGPMAAATVAAIPEPSSLAMAVGVGATLAGIRLRRRREGQRESC